MKMISMIIPKKFKVGDYLIKLKDELAGQLCISANDNDSYFKGSIYRILIKFGVHNIKSVDDIKEWILNIYLKGINNAYLLNKEELALFYFIKDVKDTTDNKKTMLFIGYEHNHIITIKNTLSQFSKCDSISLIKNLELYDEREYEKIYKDIIDKANEYNKIIIDITNVYLLRDKYKTKKLIDYMLENNKKVLLLINRYTDTFLKIFGEQYKNNIIERSYILYNGYDQSIVNHIKKILF